MEYGFNLNEEDITSLLGNRVDYYFNIGSGQQNTQKEKIMESLENHVDLPRIINADKIIKEWFPQVPVDIFLSHSHEDEKLVVALSGWLKENFNLSGFVDSTVWKHIDELLPELVAEDNRNAVHKYIMLASSLAKTMNQCKGFFFIETPNSYKFQKSKGFTNSPWLYFEMTMSQIFLSKERFSLEERKDSRPSIEYSIYPENLVPLSLKALQSWKSFYSITMMRKCPSSVIEKLEKLYEEALSS
ncbi:hypothetical protein [Cardiobacterium valvarum]|uniref:TIR domain-containing protein n=1 Tax=Cardiobacterium valvarum TaxID=194702 RepID=A0A381E7X9_9GAMM|nr:hypothetical protein [Cardiobacterium valvarum]SUX22820.1 Uncharacterised protein [Cardiobacterium valvarum]